MTTTQSAVIGAPKKGPCGRSPGPCSHCRWSFCSCSQEPTPELFPMCQRVRANPVCLRTDPPDIGGACFHMRSSLRLFWSSARAVEDRSPRRIEGKRSVLSASCLPATKSRCSKQSLEKPHVTLLGQKLARDLQFLGDDPVKGP